MLAIEGEIEGRELRSSMTKQVHDKIELMTKLIKRHMSEVPARYFNLKIPLPMSGRTSTGRTRRGASDVQKVSRHQIKVKDEHYG